MNKKKIASVVVEVNNKQSFIKFNQEEPLNNILKEICDEQVIEFVEGKYAFQFIRIDGDNNKVLSKQYAGKFVTEENRCNIINGTVLKVGHSPSELSKIIYENLSKVDGDICFSLENLAGNIHSSVFIEMVYDSCYPIIMDKLKTKLLPTKLVCYCLRTLLGFLRHNYIEEIDNDLLVNHLIVNVIDKNVTNNYILEISLCLLEETVSKKQFIFVIQHLAIEDLLHHLQNTKYPAVQECALALINKIIYYCKCEDLKLSFIKTINSDIFLSTIYSNIILKLPEPNSELSEQLYINQMFIFILLLNQLNNPLQLDVCSLPDADLVSESKRYSDFGSSASDSVIGSLESTPRNSKVISSNKEININSEMIREGLPRKGNKLTLSFLNLEIGDLSKNRKHSLDMPDLKTINELVYDCIKYFAKNYRRSYQVALCSEGCRNFISICYDIIDLLTSNILRIGKEFIANSTSYFPLVFSSTRKHPFFEELFCVAIWLFERTKRQMRSSTYDDYKKVLLVIEKQLVEGLNSKPKSFEELETFLRKFTYSDVCKKWEKERKDKQEKFFALPSVKQLRANLKGSMEELVGFQRINYVMGGSKFPSWNSQKNLKIENKFVSAYLSSNKKFIMYSEEFSLEEREAKDFKMLPLKEVQEFLVGKNCQHLKNYNKNVKDRKEAIFGFSLVTDKNIPTSVDFVTYCKTDYDYWTDALTILLGKKITNNHHKSKSCENELNTLLDMELKLKLLGVEGINCPMEPPPIPPLPDNLNFDIDEESNA